ncbi:DUF7674 family protein [Cellulosilyticum sp. I15G10I2]|uniref:DUF7674 family protein n=1 Tax=Cellulosilyticum sp. I15G10I2 TaxID=1892843 RepID=UPI00085BCE1C|nr:hypothetical protein [Cellulosilyticum sp. I15G10I2]
MVQKECVMELLISICPSFKGKWEKQLKNIWDRESETILYTDLSEFARHLAKLVKLNQVDELPAVFDKIEYLLQHGDPFVQEAVIAGLFEDFQNNLLYNKCQLDLISQYLKIETKQYWTELIKFWSGGTPYDHKH